MWCRQTAMLPLAMDMCPYRGTREEAATIGRTSCFRVPPKILLWRHLIAVILTGSGTDGAAGAIEVKNLGGIVVVQNPQTARYPSMPLALPPTVIDVEADIERIWPDPL